MLVRMALHPCGACGRHVRVDLGRCAFCDADIVAASPAPSLALARVARMAAIGAAAVTLGACAETPKNTVEIHADPSATSTATAATAAPDAAAPNGELGPDDVDPRHRRHQGGGPCGPNGQCPPYGGAPPFDNFV